MTLGRKNTGSYETCVFERSKISSDAGPSDRIRTPLRGLGSRCREPSLPSRLRREQILMPTTWNIQERPDHKGLTFLVWSE